ncbi:MAG: ATP-binding protein [Planctomycetia bacterium]|nr:ATP-binding protein [Planctomycetia bacterium]
MTKNESLFRLTLDAMCDGVVSVDKDGRITMLNPAAERMLKVESQVALGQLYSQVFNFSSPQEDQTRESPLLHALATGASVQAATELVTPRGPSRQPVHLNVSPMLNSSGQTTGAVLVIHDLGDDCSLGNSKLDAVDYSDFAAEIAKVVFFQINYTTGDLTGSTRLPQFWPTCNGKVVPSENWVLPEDVSLVEQSYRDVISGRLKRAVIVYRVVKDGVTCYHRSFFQKKSDASDVIIGLIQDVTSFYNVVSQKEAIQEMWDKVVNVIPAIFYVKDADDGFRYLQCNQRLADFFLCDKDRIIGKTDRDIFFRDVDIKTAWEHDSQVMAIGTALKFSEIIQDNSGALRRLESIKVPAKNENGHSVLIGMTYEASELFILSEIRKIISSAFEILYMNDNLEVGINNVLKIICDYLGFTRAYVSGIDEQTQSVRLFATYLPENEESIFEGIRFLQEESQDKAWYKALINAKRGEVFECDFSQEEQRLQAETYVPGLLQKYKEFDVRWVHVNYILVNGKPWGSVGFITQYREQKQLSDNEMRLLEMISHIIELAISNRQIVQKLEVALNEAQSANLAKSFFLASMSHEIRTPLNAVIGFADLLSNTKLDPVTQHDYLSNISFAGNSLLILINDILDLSKLEAGQAVFVPEITNMTEFCQEIGSIFSHNARQKNLRLSFDAEDVPDLFIDQQRMRQILFNLVGNAIKFTNVGGISVVMDFQKTGDDEGTLTVTVADTGIGVDPKDCERLFEPFVQLTRMRGTNSTNNGTGLGLPIVKKMLTQMGGSISLNSTLGTGSTFLLTIPKIKMQSQSVTDDSEHAGLGAKGLCPPNDVPRVLVVDDVPLSLKILSNMLKNMQISHDTATSGKMALDMLINGNFNIVLTDLVMPDMNGEEVARAIRANPQFASVRIAVVTAEHDRTAYDASLFDRIMEKPISRELLYNSIFGKVS